jgi:hypothetical protein
MNSCLEIAGNATLFLSSLLLLIDIAPHDFFPSHKKRVKALELLRTNRNILIKLPSNLNIAAESSGMSIVQDSESYAVLSEFIRQRSTLARSIDWSRAIGIGYAIQSLPVGQAKLEAFRPLYVALIPDGQETQLTLVPVGQLGDLDTWLSQQRQGSISKLALVFLVIGFFLQLVSSVQ